MSLARARLELLGVGCTAIALTVALAVSFRSLSTGERLARQDNVFAAFRPADIERISLQMKQVEGPDAQRSLTLERHDQQDPHSYVLEGHAEVEADRAAVVDLLSTLEFARWQRKLPIEQARDLDMGLEIPLLELDMVTPHLSQTLVVGKTSPTPPGSHYAKLSGRGVETQYGVVTDGVVAGLSRDLRRFKGQLLLPYGRSKTTRLRLAEDTQRGTNERHERILVKDEVGYLIQPENVRASREQVDLLFFHMARLSIEEYLDAGAAAALFEAGKSKLLVEQQSRGGQRVSVEIGPACPGAPHLVVARRVEPEPIAGCVALAAYNGVQAASRELRSETVFPLAADEIDHVTIERDGEDLDLLRDGAGFLLTKPVRKPVPLETGNRFVEALASTRGDLAVDPVAEQLETRGVVSVTGHPLDATQTVKLSAELLGRDESQRWLLRRLDDGQLLALPRGADWVFDPASPWHQDLQVLEFPPSQLKTLEVTEGGLSERVRMNSPDDASLTRPAGRSVDSAVLRQVTQLLSNLKAERWMHPPVDPPQDPLLKLELELQSGQRSLLIGSRVHGGYAAWLSDQQRPFVLAPQAVETLGTSLIDRAPALLAPEQIETLTIEWGRVRHDLVRQGEHLAFRDPSKTAIGPVIEELLSQLRPLSSTRAGAAAPELTPLGSDASPLVLSGSQRGTPFRYRFGPLVIHRGLPAQLLHVEGAGWYIVERARIVDLLEVL